MRGAFSGGDGGGLLLGRGDLGDRRGEGAGRDRDGRGGLGLLEAAEALADADAVSLDLAAAEVRGALVALLLGLAAVSGLHGGDRGAVGERVGVVGLALVGSDPLREQGPVAAGTADGEIARVLEGERGAGQVGDGIAGGGGVGGRVHWTLPDRCGHEGRVNACAECAVYLEGHVMHLHFEVHANRYRKTEVKGSVTCPRTGVNHGHRLMD